MTQSHGVTWSNVTSSNTEN